jgi:hypothetical protein
VSKVNYIYERLNKRLLYISSGKGDLLTLAAVSFVTNIQKHNFLQVYMNQNSEEK